MHENTDPRPEPAPSSSPPIEATTIGEAWLMLSARIMESGQNGVYDNLAMREILLATLHIAKPRARDEIIDRYADETRMAWMHANFGDRRVVELAELQDEVARAISAPIDTMTMIIKSAHIYDTDFTYMREVLSAHPNV